MSQYVIEIDDKSVTDQINGIINAVFKREINNKYGETGHEITQAVKEIVRKGLPKLLEMGVGTRTRQKDEVRE